MARLSVLLLAAVAAVGQCLPDDLVTSLPGYGPVKQTQYAGLIHINKTYDKKMFYWFVEAKAGNVPGKTPVLIWMNGGPGASSLTGLLVENIGPLALKVDDKGGVSLQDNLDTWSNNYNVMIIDNPVGAGFSTTKEGGNVRSEEEMRREYYMGLQGMLKKHPEYSKNPFWVCGESYGGKYVPNVAYEIFKRGELDLKGVIIGNGMFKPIVQYEAVPDYAFNEGIIDGNGYRLAKEKIGECIDMIKAEKNAEAKVYCEATVDWIYGSNETGAGQFYYDLGLSDGKFFDVTTNAMSGWLNSPETKKALHVGDSTWVQADETGPVAAALLDDFVNHQSMGILEELLKADKFEIVTYNGVRDGSLCNHVGHLRSMEDLEWDGQMQFRSAIKTPVRLNGTVTSFKKSYGRLTFFTLLRTGHLVPTVVPKVGLAMIEGVVGKVADAKVTADVIV